MVPLRLRVSPAPTSGTLSLFCIANFTVNWPRTRSAAAESEKWPAVMELCCHLEDLNGHDSHTFLRNVLTFSNPKHECIQELNVELAIWYCNYILGTCLPGRLISTLCDITEGRFSDQWSIFPLSFSTSGLCDNIIQDIIYTYLVLPNRINIPLVGETQLAQLRFPVPKVTCPTLF